MRGRAPTTQVRGRLFQQFSMTATLLMLMCVILSKLIVLKRNEANKQYFVFPLKFFFTSRFEFMPTNRLLLWLRLIFARRQFAACFRRHRFHDHLLLAMPWSLSNTIEMNSNE